MRNPAIGAQEITQDQIWTTEIVSRSMKIHLQDYFLPLLFVVGAILVIEFRATRSNAACPHLQGTSTIDWTAFP